MYTAFKGGWGKDCNAEPKGNLEFDISELTTPQKTKLI